MNIENMLKKQGTLALFKLITKTVTDTFYQETITVETDYTCYALIVPARAYDIHSNVFYKPEFTGNEVFGVVNVYIPLDDADYISNEDYYIDGNYRYKLMAIEKWGEYMLFEGRLE